MALETGRRVISYETIYRFIYAQIARRKDYSWRRYLPYAKSRRGRRSRKGRSPASFIAHRRPLAERPSSVADRQTPGHWEADLMLFSAYGQAVLTLHERHSRILLAVRPPGKAADPIAGAMTRLLESLPPHCAVRSPSTTAQSSHAITSSMTWASRPSSAIPTPPGRREVLRTPSDGCGAHCPERPTWRNSLKRSLHNGCRPIIILHASASATTCPPRVY